MRKGRTRAWGTLASSGVVLCLALPAVGQERGSAPVIWQDRGAAGALDLVSGSGGKGHEPGSSLRFIQESRDGTSPKFEVEDEQGTRWTVTLGEEAKSETAATRLLWAAGYLVDEDYYRLQIYVAGLPRLTRGQQFVSANGAVNGARLERVPDAGRGASSTWSWYDNPFTATREFNGLRVMMALVDNGDLKEVNNAVSDPASGVAMYRISDLGATFGRTGNARDRTKGVVNDYADTQFVKQVTSTHVDFGLRSRPFFLSAFNPTESRFRTRMQGVVEQIPIADARWIGARLSQLSAEQIADCFRVGGFPPEDVEAYTRVVLRRIAALTALDAPPPPVSVDVPADVTSPVVAGADTGCIESTCRYVPVRETLTAIGIGGTHARALLGGFEQGAGMGGGVLVTSATAIPVLELRATAMVSSRLYRRVDLEALFSSIRGSRNHVDVWFSYARRDTAFFDIGPRASTDLETEFELTRRSYQGSFLRDLSGRLQTGAFVQVMNTRAAPGAADTTGTLVSQRFPGTLDESPARWLPGLDSTTRIRSFGGFLAYDTRDNSVGLTRGLNLYGRLASSDGQGQPNVQADYGWLEGEVDARAYVPLGGPKTSLQLRSRGLLKAPKSGSQIPFYDLAWLGGRTYVRGYSSYRFRGNNMLLVSTEVQRTVSASTGVRGVDVFTFVDAGQVWGDARSSTDPVILDNQAFSSRNWHAGWGGGVQYRHSRSVAVRLEAGRSPEGTVLYFSLSRGF